jgi:uncharacterized protein (TIGR03435 family)
LKLDPVEVPLSVVVVDSVERKPTPNLPKIEEALHISPPPTEFEVAEINLTPPDSKIFRFQVLAGGRINLIGIPLKVLIQQAWDVNDDTLIGTQGWMDTDRYDIVAKTDAAGRDLDFDDVLRMLKALLVERFQIKAHMEERPANAYTLISVKPKMKKADPNSRTKYNEGPGADGKDPRDKNPILSRLVTCQNMTMAEFAERLKTVASGYIHTPVLDATGLEGGYDFTLSFSAVQLTRANFGGAGRGGLAQGGPPASGDPSAAASDPSGAVSLFEAIERQLGLKLQAKKRPIPVLVIDHIEQRPTEN